MGELRHAHLSAFLGFDELFDFLENEALLEVVIGGVFLSDSVFQFLHQGVHDHLVLVGGLAYQKVEDTVPCHAIQVARVALNFPLSHA